MEYIKKIKKKLCKELEELSERNSFSDPREMETLWKITDTIKNLDKIKMMQEGGYSEGMHSYDEGGSYARGRRYAKRDSMGRYSRDDGYSEEYSERGHSSYADSSYGNSYGEYSQHGNDRVMEMLGGMMHEANPKQREALKKCMREMENA